MKVKLEFWVYDPSTEKYWHSQENTLCGFVLEQLPPIGTGFRFDLPLRDECGRYACSSRSFEIEGGSPLCAKVAGIEIDADINFRRKHPTLLILHVDRCNDSVVYVGGYVAELIRLQAFRLALKRARKISIQEVGFPDAAIDVMQTRKCDFLSDVAIFLSPDSFEIDIFPQVESVLRQYGLLLSADRGTAINDGPMELPR